MTLSEAMAAVLEHGCRLGVRNRQPTISGKLPPEIVKVLSENRQVVLEFLQSGQGGEHEGLVCSACQAPLEGTKMIIRFCSDHGHKPHWSRI